MCGRGSSSYIDLCDFDIMQASAEQSRCNLMIISIFFLIFFRAFFFIKILT